MINPPKTKKEAEGCKYSHGHIHYGHVNYDSTRCAMEAWAKWQGFYQCSRRPGHGPDKLFCKQHAKKVGE